MRFVGTGEKIDAVELEKTLFSSAFETRFEQRQDKVVLIVGTTKAPICSFECDKGTKVTIRCGERINTSENPDDPEFKIFDILEDLGLVKKTRSRIGNRNSSTCTNPPTEADTTV